MTKFPPDRCPNCNREINKDTFFQCELCGIPEAHACPHCSNDFVVFPMLQSILQGSVGYGRKHHWYSACPECRIKKLPYGGQGASEWEYLKWGLKERKLTQREAANSFNFDPLMYHEVMSSNNKPDLIIPKVPSEKIPVSEHDFRHLRVHYIILPPLELEKRILADLEKSRPRWYEELRKYPNEDGGVDISLMWNTLKDLEVQGKIKRRGDGSYDLP